MPGRELDIMSDLQIVAESQSMGARDIAERLEEVHCQCVAFGPGATDELGENANEECQHSIGIQGSPTGLT